MTKPDKKKQSLKEKEQGILEAKIESYIEGFIDNYDKLRKDNAHMNQGLQSKLFEKPVEELVEKVAVALGIHSKTNYTVELKTDYLVGDGSMGRTTNAFSESCKKLISNLTDNPQVSIKSKLYNAVSSIAGKLGLRQVELKFNEKAKDAQISSSMKSLNSSQKKLLKNVKDIIVEQKGISEPRISMADYLKNEKKQQVKNDRGRV